MISRTMEMFKGGEADFSSCKTWRYNLKRFWDQNKPRLCFVMLNPSTATADTEDATTRRVLKMAREWGFGSYEAVNLFALRSVSPKLLKKVEDPIGPENDYYIQEAVESAEKVVAAWGVHGTYLDRNQDVLKLLSSFDIHYLKLSKDGHPCHPLYLPSGLEPKLLET